ncbi:MAG: hypothetical protein PHC88_04975 [Terrimicrobiaceae bacterium]|nr:hypothetical protein [Terrimicrobiaceae bacterium]
MGYYGTVNPEQILPGVLLNVVPTGLKGLIVVAMFAATMSAKKGLMNNASGQFVRDIYQNFLRPNACNRELITASYGQFLVMTGLSFLGAVGASLLTPPTPREVLRKFYRGTRPFGWWRPLRGELQGAERETVDRENRTDILTLPFAFVWHVPLLLLPMQLVAKSYPAFWSTLPFFLIGLAGMYFLWWKPLLRMDAPAIPDGSAAAEPEVGLLAKKVEGAA